MVCSFADYVTDIFAFVICFYFPETLHWMEIDCIYYIFFCFLICNIRSAYKYSENSLISIIAHLIGLGVFFEWFNLDNTYADTLRFKRTKDIHLVFETIPSGGLYFCLAMLSFHPTSVTKHFEIIRRNLSACISLLTIAYSCQDHFTSHLTDLVSRGIFGFHMAVDIVVRTFTFVIMASLIPFSNSTFAHLSFSLLMLLTIITKIIYFRKFKWYKMGLNVFFANFTSFPIMSHVYKEDCRDVFCPFHLEYITQHALTIYMILFAFIHFKNTSFGFVFAIFFIVGLIFQFFSRSVNPIPWYVILLEEEEREDKKIIEHKQHELQIDMLITSHDVDARESTLYE